jgi:hypothetical protein
MVQGLCMLWDRSSATAVSATGNAAGWRIRAGACSRKSAVREAALQCQAHYFCCRVRQLFGAAV